MNKPFIMSVSVFKNSKHQLRHIWWVAIFFFVLAAITFAMILLSQYYKFELTILYQAVIVIAASLICQLWRKEPLSQLFGVFNIQWLKSLGRGLMIGAALMITPSFILLMLGSVTWHMNSVEILPLFSVTILFTGVAIAEEVLFRGFLFQRLIDSTGQWTAQIIIAAYFLLIHLNNPGMAGTIKVLTSINIFSASIMFGLAFIRTKSLAMPIGIHFMANWVQGVALGFGVSGHQEASLMRPVFNAAPDWLTGGAFGLEASIPGLVCVILTSILIYKGKAVSHHQKDRMRFSTTKSSD